MSTSFVGDITFMNTSTTGICVLQTTDEVDIGGHYNSTLEQGQCFVVTVLTLPQTAPERMSNVEQPLAKARGSAHSLALATHRGAHHLFPRVVCNIQELTGYDAYLELISCTPLLVESTIKCSPGVAPTRRGHYIMFTWCGN